MLALPAAVQPQGATTTPAVQPLPSREALELSAALSRLSRDPRNVDSLVDAGIAASKIGDFEAAVGFFKRGQALAPSNPRLLAGLAGALMRQGDAEAAIPLFAQALAAGAPASSLAADRGLAYDLVGDPLSAQRYYLQALATGVDGEEVAWRLAISQAISGDASAMEKTLLPLLKKQDKAAWRTRAFGLAILGQNREASRIVKTLLPGTLANSISPYLQYMPRLTRAQQAAAANLGIFPRASEIGRDEARIAALAPSGSVRDVGKALVPTGQPLGPGKNGASAVSAREQRRLAKLAETKARSDAKLAEEQRKRETRVALNASKRPRVGPPEVMPAREDAPSGETGFTVSSAAPVPPVAEILAGRRVPEPPVAAPAPSPSLAVVQPATLVKTSVPLAAVTAATSAPPTTFAAQSAPAVTAPASSSPVSAPGFYLARLPGSPSPAQLASAPTAAATMQQPAPAPAPAPATAPAPISAPVPSFGALFADLGKPTSAADPAAGALDMRKIKPARPQPKPKPKPEADAMAKKALPSQPSRIWVQLGIGQKLGALSQDWRRMENANSALFKGKSPFTARLNQTNRLLTGPFSSPKEANRFMDALGKAGAPRPLLWTSPAGEVVDDLSR